ncbi:hypothetical protein V7161_10890 [Neobacillus drentensis]|uniref:hypothetical protein n=1 Tax=Neobacillus drentensis TaxID=220684 RepID=UPI0030002439
MNGKLESVRFSSVKAQILETIILSEEPVTIRQVSKVLWGYDSENMSESYVPRMIKVIRTDLKTAKGIDGKELFR